MAVAEEKKVLPHKLTLNERRSLSVTGVTGVVSFDEQSVVLHTGLGTLIVQGKGLSLRQLTAEGGQVAVEGNVSSLVYEEPRQAVGFFRRLLG